MSSANPSPGNLSRLELAAGDLLKRIAINGNYLFVEKIQLNYVQEIKPEYLIQGGPNVGISSFQGKTIEGEISFPLLINSAGGIDPAAQAILNSATFPSAANALRVDTNHVLSDLNITAEDGGTDNNALIALDTVLVSNLTISTAPNQGVKITVKMIGLILLNEPSSTVSEPVSGMETRNVSFGDCAVSRIQSRMRGTVGLEVNITNNITKRNFLIGLSPQNTSVPRSDQASALIVSTVKWGGSYDEFTRLGASTEDYMHGGWMVGQNMVVDFGCVVATFPTPVFQITPQPLTKKIYKRHSEFYGQMSPGIATGLFAYKTIG